MDLSVAIVVMVSVTMVTMSGSLPTGAPTAACIPMRPHHPPTTTFGVAPFVLDVSHLYYVPGSVITGKVQSIWTFGLRQNLILFHVNNLCCIRTFIIRFLKC